MHHPNSRLNYDKNGAWANQGQINQTLLKQLLSDDYFTISAPKSTGREYFHLAWLNRQFELCANLKNSLVAQDVQATLTVFTGITIANDIKRLAKNGTVYLCGGGIHNQQLKNEINQQLHSEPSLYEYELLPTSANGVDGDLLEAIAFAWLAYAYDNKLLSNMPKVTGASKACTLGTAYIP
jgi:anhydro-N-acetylmuramic acid kinase